MTIELINLGNIANDGTGDDLRTAFEKVNLNFVELDTSIDASTVGVNVGDGAEIYKEKVGNQLRFRTLDSGETLSVTVVGDKIVVDTNFIDKDITVGSLTTQGGLYVGTVIEAGTVTASVFNGNVIGTVYPPGPSRIIGVGNINGFNPTYGTVGYEPARVDGISVQDLYRQVNTIDFGSITGTFTDPITYLLSQVGLELGTFTSPSPIQVDGGSL